MARRHEKPHPADNAANDSPFIFEDQDGGGADGPSVATATPESETERLKARVAELEKQLDQQQDQHLRAIADFQNTRRRIEEGKNEAIQFANREVILGLLPVLDNFERALAAAEKSQSYEALMGGVALTLRQLQDFLKKNGVEPIAAQGQEFDPNFHEAVARVDDGDHPENSVVEELQRGYTMHNRVLRPSMVKVARSE